MKRHGGQAEIGPESQRWRGHAVELLVVGVLSIVLALIVGLAGSAMTAPPDTSVRTPIFPMIEVNEEDFNPRDPLVRCTVLETHTHCIREAS
jgi:hypothetical protein